MRLCIAGSGTGGLEALLAAKTRLSEQTELCLVAPDREFRYRPVSRASLFRPATERSLDIGELVAEVGAEWVVDRVQAVHEPERSLLTRAGDAIEYDHLLLAVGARAKRALRQGHVWIRGGDPEFLDRLMLALRHGEAGSVAVAVPTGARWSIPAYELALVLAWTAPNAQVTLLTAEPAPLVMLGSVVSSLIGQQLEAAGVETAANVEPADAVEEDESLPERPRLRLGPATVREFDALISLPTIRGPFLAGTPTDAAGFIEVDAGLQVCGCDRAWAVGRCIAAALEHEGLGARQADAAVAAIASAGQAAKPGALDLPPAPEVTGLVLSDQREAWLAENPTGTSGPSTRCLWWPPGRAVGPRLARRIAAWDPGVEPSLRGHPQGFPVRVPVALGCDPEPFVMPDGRPDPGTQRLRLRDIEHRQLMAVRRQERAAERELRELKSRLVTFDARERQVVRELKMHGYLQNR